MKIDFNQLSLKKTVGYPFLMLCLVGCHQLYQPESTSVSSVSLAQAAQYNVQLGLAYLQRGDTSRAKEKLLRAQSQSPRSPIVKGALGYFFSKIGEWRQAKVYYLKSLALDPKSGAAHNNYGSFLCQQRHYVQAERHFLQAVRDPRYLNIAAVYENAGLCALQIPDIPKGIHYFQEALKQDPKRQTARSLLLHYSN